MKVTFCVRGVISPLLANLFLHYAFDAWISRNYRHIPFARYADDAICHCKSAEEARALWSALQERFAGGSNAKVVGPSAERLVQLIHQPCGLLPSTRSVGQRVDSFDHALDALL